MKIALIDPSLFTPPYDCALMEGLRHAGDDVRLYTRYSWDAEIPGTDASIIEHFYPFLARKAARRLSPLPRRVLKAASHPGCMRRLIHRLGDWKPDIIHFQWLPLPAVDRFFIPSFRAIAPLVFTMHDSVPFNGNPAASVQRWGALSILRHFDALIVHTSEARMRLASQGLLPEKINLIAHGLFYDDLRSLDPADLNPNEKPVVDILFFGKLKPYKGVDVLIRAFSLLAPAERAQCRVRVVGEPHMDCGPLLDLAKSLGVASHFEFDFRFVPDSEIRSVFGPASVVVFPYREIDASGVLMATVSAGKPIIASKIGAFAEILHDGRDCLLVPPNDENALAQAMRQVLSDGGLTQHLATGVRQLRDATPTWKNIGQSTQAVYEGLAEVGRHRFNANPPSTTNAR